MVAAFVLAVVSPAEVPGQASESAPRARKPAKAATPPDSATAKATSAPKKSVTVAPAVAKKSRVSKPAAPPKAAVTTQSGAGADSVKAKSAAATVAEPGSAAAPAPAPAPASAPAAQVAAPAAAPAAAAIPMVSAPVTSHASSAPVARRQMFFGTPDSLRSRWRVPTPIVWVASPLDRRVSPGMGFASPGGYGPAWGDVFGSVSYQQRTRRTQVKDGGFGVGIGLGDPARYVGAELAYAGNGTSRSGFFTNATLSARLHRIVGGYGISIGQENITQIGATSGPGPDGGRSNFLAVSRLLRLGVRDTLSIADSMPGRELLWTVGVGDGRFRREQDVFAGKSTVNVFASVGFRFHERFAAIVDYTGQDVAVALSVVPFRCFPLMVTPGFADVAGIAGDGARFVVAVGMTARLDPRSFFSSRCSR